MAMVLSEDQQLLRDSARSFCQDNAPISVMRRLRDEKSELGYDEAIWQQMIELGWPGMAIAEKYGGFEFGYTGLGLVLEETGRTLASSPLIASVLLGASLLSEAGNEEQKSSYSLKLLAVNCVWLSVLMRDPITIRRESHAQP